MEALPIDEATIRQYASADSFGRGRAYARQGAVSDLARRGQRLQAAVQGSEDEPYQVDITFDEDGVAMVDCTCPYDWGGWCKHIVAVLLVALDQPAAIEERPPLEETLAGLDRDQLQALLLRLAEQNAAAADAIEQQAVLLRATAAAQDAGRARAARPPSIDTRPIRRQTRAILTSRYAYDYGYAGSAVAEVSQLVQQARQLTAAGDAGNALLMLEAVTDEYTQHWFDIDDSDGELGGYFEELGAAWIEALLAAELPPAERRAWAEKLRAWQREADDYGVDDWLGQAALAAEEGWADPDLQRALRGEPVEPGAWEDAEELTRIRLTVLEQQGRHEEYLNLARAAGLAQERVVMLARLGRTAEATEVGLRSLTTADEALALATTLHAGGEIEPALRVAEHGLGLAEPRAALAGWLTETALGLGRRDLALRAAETAFRSAPSLAIYQTIQTLTGERWPEHRAALLEELHRLPSSWLHTEARVDIFLHEGLIDDAIAVVKGDYTYTLLERVVDAAIGQRPAWAIQAATQQAARIMDAGQSEHYDYAIGWLRRARDAYQAAGRAADWRGYLAALRERHGRKYKLMRLMNGL
jgi:uncharacterized Zn finger protein